jgi:putative DNA primase/helicase
MKKRITKPSACSINTAAIPAELKELRQWVVWREEPRDNGKMAKVPVDPKTGRNASVNDPSTWGTCEEAQEYCEKFKDQGCCGIGFVFTASDPYVGIDLDNCRNPETGEIQTWAEEIVLRLNSYTELSPSGTGLHVIVQGQLPAGGRRKSQVEMYDRGRFFTMTGQALHGYTSTIENRQKLLEEIHGSLLGSQGGSQQGTRSGASTQKLTPEWQALLDQMEDAELTPEDEEILRQLEAGQEGKIYQLLALGKWEEVGAYRKKGYYDSISEADQALMNKLARLTGGDPGRMKAIFAETGLMRPKIDDHPTYLARTIKTAIAGLAWQPNQMNGNIQGVNLDG